MNAMIKKFMSMGITNLVINLNNFMMSIFNSRRLEVFEFFIFPKINILLTSNIGNARLSSVRPSSNDIFLVDNIHTVEFSTKKCSCIFLMEFEFPCIHLCAVILSLRIYPFNFVDHHFKTTNYNNSYSISIAPMIAKA
jgi:hypothetical protein